MMIEPPGQIRVRCVLEVDDRINIAVKKAVFKQLIGPMRQTRVVKFRLRIKALFEEPADERCRRGAVKAVIVIQDANIHLIVVSAPKTF
jgi:hypothetical protein